MCCFASSLLTIHVFASPVCEWLLCPNCFSSLLTIPVIGSPGCEQLLCLALFQACWQSLSLAVQEVSGCCALLCFKLANNSCPWLSSGWVAVMPCCVSSLLTIPVLGSPGGEWLLCLAMFLACWQSLSLALQWVSGYCVLLCFRPVDNPCPWLSSGWVLLLCFKPVDNPCPWLSSLCVVAVSCCISRLLTIPIIGSSACEWLLCLAVFQAC